MWDFCPETISSEARKDVEEMSSCVSSHDDLTSNLPRYYGAETFSMDSLPEPRGAGPEIPRIT